jgi:hypothetical protein
MAFKLMKEKKPTENGLYQVFDRWMGWNLAFWDDGEWSFAPNTTSRENSEGYLSYYHVISWDYLQIPREIDGKSTS